MICYEMTTLVATCRTSEGGQDLANFMEKRFAGNDRCKIQALKFAVVDKVGKISVHCDTPVNDLGRQEFKAAIDEFLSERKTLVARKSTILSSMSVQQTTSVVQFGLHTK